MKRLGLLVGISATIMLVLGVAIAASVSNETVTIIESVYEDLYIAGNTLDVQASVEGDLVAAGRNLVVSADVLGDVLAAGESLRLDAPVSDDVRMAGRSVAINEVVGGHLVATGETIIIGPDASVADWAWLAGRNLELQGNIGPGSRLAGRTVTLSGEVRGDLTVYANQLILTPTARIGGDLNVHTSNAPQINNEAQIAGELRVQTDAAPDPDSEWQPGFGVFGALLAIVTSVVLYLVFPAFLVAGVDRIKASPFKSVGLGLVFLIATPLVTVALFLTGVGAVLGLVLLAVYLLMLLAGTVTGSVLLASLGLRLAGKEEAAGRVLSAAAVALAVVLVQLVQWVPIGGAIFSVLLFLTGLGAAVAAAWRTYREG